MYYLSRNIGINLNRIRESRLISLDNAAEQTGVSKSMLHQIEKGTANPSINVVDKICSGLRIEFTELISTPRTETCLVRVKEMTPTKKVDGQYVVYTCFPYEDNKKVEIYRIEIEPNGIYESGSHGENTREYISVIEGEVDIELNGSVHRVTIDDVFKFESGVLHRYINKGDKKTSFWSFFVC